MSKGMEQVPQPEITTTSHPLLLRLFCMLKPWFALANWWFQHAKEARQQEGGGCGNFGLQCDISALQEAIANRLCTFVPLECNLGGMGGHSNYNNTLKRGRREGG